MTQADEGRERRGGGSGICRRHERSPKGRNLRYCPKGQKSLKGKKVAFSEKFILGRDATKAEDGFKTRQKGDKVYF